MPPIGSILYKRSRFSTRLMESCRYTRSHTWLGEHRPGIWRIGLTGFATRMLGSIVEFDFETDSGAPVRVAEVIGWIEGFKAVSDLYCVARGTFAGSNPEAGRDPSRIDRDPQGEGWLYAVKGEPDPDVLDLPGYIAFLDATIDRMLERPWEVPRLGEAEEERR